MANEIGPKVSGRIAVKGVKKAELDQGFHNRCAPEDQDDDQDDEEE